MIQFTTILHDKREELDISMLEYVVLDTIEKLSRPKFRAHRKTLAEFIGMSRSGLIKAINRLVEKGLLIRVNDKELAVTQKWIDETIKCQQSEQQVSTKCTPSVDKVDSQQRDRTKELEINKDLDSDFEIFYSDYPRKIAKPTAKTAYEKARGKATHDEIMRGVFISPRLKKDDPQFLPYPATWLNQEGWTDGKELDPLEFPFPNLELRELTTGDKVYVDKVKALVYEQSGNISSVWYFDRKDQAVDMI